MKTFKKIKPDVAFILGDSDYPAQIRAVLDNFHRHAARCVECSPRLERVRRMYGASNLCPLGIKLQSDAERLREMERARHGDI